MSKSPEEEHPVKAFGWAARDQSGHLSPFNFSRRWSLVSLSPFFCFYFSFGYIMTMYICICVGLLVKRMWGSRCYTAGYAILTFTVSRMTGASPCTLWFLGKFISLSLFPFFPYLRLLLITQVFVNLTKI